MRGGDSSTINGLLLSAAAVIVESVLPVKVTAALGFEVAKIYAKRSTNSCVAMVPAVRLGRSEKYVVSVPTVALKK